jgi:hypothetical protein
MAFFPLGDVLGGFASEAHRKYASEANHCATLPGVRKTAFMDWTLNA